MQSHPSQWSKSTVFYTYDTSSFYTFPIQLPSHLVSGVSAATAMTERKKNHFKALQSWFEHWNLPTATVAQRTGCSDCQLRVSMSPIRSQRKILFKERLGRVCSFMKGLKTFCHWTIMHSYFLYIYIYMCVCVSLALASEGQTIILLTYKCQMLELSAISWYFFNKLIQSALQKWPSQS